jgi:hypothetical protein
VILDNPAHKLEQCPKCGKKLSTSTLPEPESTRARNQKFLSQHFERMPASTTETEVETWPEEYADYFPVSEDPDPVDTESEWISELDGAQSKAEHDQTSAQEETGFSTREREEAHRKMLRSKGYVVDLDSNGMRLTSISTGRNNPVTNLSPYDVVRLASELEGGVIPVEERIKCPACEAVILPTDKICSWCSAPLALS